MKPVRNIFSILLSVLVVALFLPIEAQAQRASRSTGTPRLSKPTVRTGGNASRIQRTPSGTSGTRSSGLRAPGRSVNRFGNIPSNRGLNNKRNGVNDLGDLLRSYQRDRDRHHYEDERADAYRDAAIVNAVTGLIGIFVAASIMDERNATPPPPQGHYVTERVLVREGYYEKYKVWIEPRYDSRTGRKLGGGFYETRTRWVPPVWEERQVWVPAR